VVIFRSQKESVSKKFAKHSSKQHRAYNLRPN